MTEAIKDIIAVTGPVLVLLSFFTTQRSSELRALKGDTNAGTPDYTREMILATALPAVTLGLIALYAAVFVDALKVIFGEGNATSLTWAPVLIMFLLICLLAYQIFHATQAWKAREDSK